MPASAEKLALRIIQRLQSAGHVAYFAGGCVRDRVMGRTPKDFDVATSARPEQVLALFPRGQQVGAAFGVILVVERAPTPGDPRLQVEVATFRADGTYSDGRHPDSVQFTTAQEDARRRDFTCNGLFLDPLADAASPFGGQIHDFVGGLADIEARTLRAIGDPAARFGEDHLRMLRAVRFAARLEFTIEHQTRAAIVGHAARIKEISRERIGEELRMILAHPSRALAVALLADLGLLPQIWPLPLALPGSPARLNQLPPATNRAIGLAALALDYARNAPVTEDADRLQLAFALANEERDEIAWLWEKLPILRDERQWGRATLKRLLAEPRWPDLQALFEAESGEGTPSQLIGRLASWAEELRAEGLVPAQWVTGETLIRLGAQPGPNFKRWLEQLYDRQLEGQFRTAEEAVEAARALIQGSK